MNKPDPWQRLSVRGERMLDPGHIRAELAARGKPIAALARDLGVSIQTVSAAIRRPTSRRVERAIARALGMAPREIWPDRYPATKRASKEAA